MGLSPQRVMTGVVFAGVATLGAEMLFATQRRLPQFPDHDVSITIGPIDVRPINVVVLGDSSVTGPGLAHPGDAWIQAALRRVSEYHFDVDSFARGGARSADVLRDQLDRATERSYDLAIVSVGGNDAVRGVSTAQLEINLHLICDRLLGSCGIVVLCGIGDIGTAPRLPFPLSKVMTLRSKSADRVHARVAADKMRVRKVPMWELTVQQFRTRDDIWSDDLFHPNHLGHGIWADAIYPTIADAVHDIAATMGLS